MHKQSRRLILSFLAILPALAPLPASAQSALFSNDNLLADNQVSILQDGSNNRADLEQSFVESGLLGSPALSNGNGNAINLRQQGQRNQASIIQNGQNNSSNLTQSGNDNSTQQLQQGDANQIDLNQKNGGNAAQLQQFGNNLSFSLTQSGGESISVTQYQFGVPGR